MENASQASSWQTFKRLLKKTKPYKYGLYVAIIGMLGYGAVDASFIYFLQPLIDEGLTGKDPDFMYYAPFAVVILVLFRGLSHFIGNYCLAWVGNNVVMVLRQEVFEHTLKMPVTFHDQESTGRLISKLTYDSEQVSQATSKSLLTLVQQGAFVLGLLVVMFYQSWQLSLIFLLTTPVIAVIVSFISKRFRKISANIQSAVGEVSGTAEQTFNGHKEILAFGSHKRESEQFYQINKQNRQQRMKLVAAQTTSVPLIQVTASFGLAFVLYFANLDSMQGVISPGEFTAVFSSMLALLKPIKQLTTVNADLQRGLAAAESLFSLLDSEPEQDTGTEKLGRAKGQIRFNNVCFAYPTTQEKLALNNMNLTIEAGQTVAFVGRSGSGKTTASSMALRFYTPNSGEIYIDDKNIADVCLADLRKQFAYVSQQVVLFNGSIAENIAYGEPDATEEEIMVAAKAAYVWDFAKNLPEQLATNVGENGSALSGGQRQRIAIARAILRDAPFLILDEATSALDTESERHIQKALENLQKGRTSIVIAHRLSTIENADKIIVMDQGQIVEQGTHQSLLAKNGMYAQLHNLAFDE